MFDQDSRYAKLPLKETTDEEGRTVAYVARRIVPDRAAIAETAVQPGDRLDLLAHRVYGDPRQSWRIRDANPDPSFDPLPDLPRADGAEPPYPVGARLKLTQIEPE